MADKPTGALDSYIGMQVFNTLKKVYLKIKNLPMERLLVIRAKNILCLNNAISFIENVGILYDK